MTYGELMALLEGILRYYRLLDSDDERKQNKNYRYAMWNLKSDIEFRVKQLLGEA